MRKMRDRVEGSRFALIMAHPKPKLSLNFMPLGLTAKFIEEIQAVSMPIIEMNLQRGVLEFPESPKGGNEIEVARSPRQNMPWHVGTSESGSISSRKLRKRQSSPGFGALEDDFDFDFASANHSTSDEFTSHQDLRVGPLVFDLGAQNADVQEANSFLNYITGIMAEAGTDYGKFSSDSLYSGFTPGFYGQGYRR